MYKNIFHMIQNFFCILIQVDERHKPLYTARIDRPPLKMPGFGSSIFGPALRHLITSSPRPLSDVEVNELFDNPSRNNYGTKFYYITIEEKIVAVY